MSKKQEADTAINTSNIGNQSVSTSNVAKHLANGGNVNSLLAFEWTEKSGTPLKYWGTDSNGKSWAYSPSEMHVGSAENATTAGTATTISSILPANLGGTGVTSLASLKHVMGLDNVDNTRDVNKTVSKSYSADVASRASLADNCKNMSGNVDLMAASSKVRATNVSASAYASIEALAFTNMSSEKTKENIKNISDDEARKIISVNIVSFDYKENFGGKRNNFGVIAEQVLDIIPFAVDVPDNYDENMFAEEKGIEQPIISVDYTKFVPYIIKMLQIQQDEINELKSKL